MTWIVRLMRHTEVNSAQPLFVVNWCNLKKNAKFTAAGFILSEGNTRGTKTVPGFLLRIYTELKIKVLSIISFILLYPCLQGAAIKQQLRNGINSLEWNTPQRPAIYRTGISAIFQAAASTIKVGLMYLEPLYGLLKRGLCTKDVSGLKPYPHTKRRRGTTWQRWNPESEVISGIQKKRGEKK